MPSETKDGIMVTVILVCLVGFAVLMAAYVFCGGDLIRDKCGEMCALSPKKQKQLDEKRRAKQPEVYGSVV